MGERVGAVRWVARNPALRRVALAFFAFAIAEFGTWLAVLVYAYGRGGVGESGTVAVVLLLPALVTAPLAAFAGDRFRPHRALTVGYVVQALTTGLTAVAMAADRPILAYAAAAAATAAISFTRPIMGALLPLTCERPADLIAVNVVMGVLANLGLLLGPIAAGAVLAVWSPATAFAAAAVVLALSAVLTVGVRLAEHADAGRPRIDAGDVVAEVVGGLSVLRRNGALAAIVGLVAMGAFASGLLDVAVVTFAEDRLGRGGGTAGLLAGSVGLGALVGSAAAIWIAGGEHLLTLFALCGAVIGTPLVVMAWISTLALSLAALTLTGVGLGVLTVLGTLAVQRRSPVRYRGRVFGALEAIQTLGLALGAAAFAAVANRFGLTAALVSLGAAIAAVMALGAGAHLLVAGDLRPPPADVVRRLQHDPLLKFLELPAVEQLAARVTRCAADAGSPLVVEGSTDHEYYLIVEGTAVVTRNGNELAHLGPGHSFGEIAALRNVPRTATVTASSHIVMLSIAQLDFIEAVNGHTWSLREANSVVDDHLSR